MYAIDHLDVPPLRSAGGTVRLPRLIGVARAKAILLTGERVDAQTALQYGIVTEVAANGVPVPCLQAACKERLDSVAHQPKDLCWKPVV